MYQVGAERSRRETEVWTDGRAERGQGTSGGQPEGRADREQGTSGWRPEGRVERNQETSGEQNSSRGRPGGRANGPSRKGGRAVRRGDPEVDPTDRADQGVGRTANCKGGNPLEAEQEADGEDWNSLEAGGGGKTPLEA